MVLNPLICIFSHYHHNYKINSFIVSILQMRKLRLGSALTEGSIADKGHCQVCTHVLDPRAWHLGAEQSDLSRLSIIVAEMTDSVTCLPTPIPHTPHLGRGQVSAGPQAGERKAGERVGICLKACLFKSRVLPLSLGGRKAAQSEGWKTRQQAHNRATPQARPAFWPRKDSGQLDLHTADPFSYLKIRNTEYKL